jgi:hypothetical protein
MTKREPIHPHQTVPLLLTAVVFLFGVGILWAQIQLLNLVLPKNEILTGIQWSDVLVGLTIYLKTAIDFAIFIGRLMDKYPGWVNRIAIECGTALGNILGTLAIIVIWTFFKEVNVLLALMIVLASLVLLRLAEDGFEHVRKDEKSYHVSFWGIEKFLDKLLHRINRLIEPAVGWMVPHMNAEVKRADFIGLVVLAFSVPFILGLDDFAGYVPLFSVVNVYGFAIGVFLGHMILNIALFISPAKTIRAVKHPVISFFGSLAFIGLAVWGLIEAFKLLFGLH